MTSEASDLRAAMQEIEEKALEPQERDIQQTLPLAFASKRKKALTQHEYA